VLASVLNEPSSTPAKPRGDAATAGFYRETIQPDEVHYHELGRRLLLRLAVTDEEQARARTAALRTLEIAQEIRDPRGRPLEEGYCARAGPLRG
jgi:hypothetical protein